MKSPFAERKCHCADTDGKRLADAIAQYGQSAAKVYRRSYPEYRRGSSPGIGTRKYSGPGQTGHENRPGGRKPRYLNLNRIVKETVLCLKKMGAEPFIVPAMGSHGGATRVNSSVQSQLRQRQPRRQQCSHRGRGRKHSGRAGQRWKSSCGGKGHSTIA